MRWVYWLPRSRKRCRSIIQRARCRLPEGFQVQSVSSDLQWFTSTTGELYYLPEPNTLILAIMAVALFAIRCPGTCFRGRHG